MKKIALLSVLLVAGFAQAGIIETVDAGSGLGPLNWTTDDNGIITWASATDAELVFTVTAVADNGDTMKYNTGRLSVNSDARQILAGTNDVNTARLSNDEAITVTISYVDPNASLLALSLDSLQMYSLGATEVVIFSDGLGASTSISNQPAEFVSASTFGVDTLTKDNTGSWTFNVAADPLANTTTGLQGMRFEYEVIPEPATLGLVAAFGAGLMFIRRRFMM